MTAQVRPYRLFTDATHLYWTTKSAGMRVPLSGGLPHSLATGVAEPNAVTADSEGVYWSDEHSVMKITANGGPPRFLAANQERPARNRAAPSNGV